MVYVSRASMHDFYQNQLLAPPHYFPEIPKLIKDFLVTTFSDE